MAQNPANVYVDPDTASVTAAFGTNAKLREKAMHHPTVAQSFAIDYKNRLDNPYIYVIQAQQTSTDIGNTKGDLVITKLDAAGNKVGTGMFLVHDHYSNSYYWKAVTDSNGNKIGEYWLEGNGDHDRSWGWGHGHQIAIEYAPDGIYLWTECISEVLDTTRSTHTYKVTGDDVARFKYQDGTFYAFDAEIASYSNKNELFASTSIDANRCSNFSISFDNHKKTVAVKYKDNSLGGRYRLSFFSYTYGADNYPVFKHIRTMDMPTVPWYSMKNGVPSNTKADLPSQGFTIFGDFIYLLFGTAYNHAEHFSPQSLEDNGGKYPDGTTITNVGNTHILQYNWRTGVKVDFNITEAGQALSYREPEGMHMIPTTDAAGNVTKLQLCFGIVSGVSGARLWSLYAKERTGIPTT